MQDSPSRALQHVLFYIPYLLIGIAGVAPFVVATQSMLSVLVAAANWTLLVAFWLLSLLDNRTLVQSTGLVNMAAVPVLLLAQDGAAANFYGLWTVVYLAFGTYGVVVPSQSKLDIGTKAAKLYMGNQAAAMHKNCTATHILDLTHQAQTAVSDPAPDTVLVKKVSLDDQSNPGLPTLLPGQVAGLMDFVKSNIEKSTVKSPVCLLIVCNDGRSLAPAMVVAYLVSTQGLSFDEAVQKVRTVRPVVDLSTRHLQLVRGYLETKDGKKKK